MAPWLLALVMGFAVGFALGTMRMADKAVRGWNYECGERVLVKKYEASDWELATVVAVSWHGAVCVRPEGEEKGYWIKQVMTETRVKRLGA